MPEGDPSLTPLSEFFCYHIFGLPRALQAWQEDVSSYSLQIGGLIDPPVKLSLAEIREAHEPVSRVLVLQCMSKVRWGRIGFTGARLWDVLQTAGIPRGAFKLAIHGADGYATDLTVEEVRRQPDAFLLAYAMGGGTVPPQHGFPLRSTADGKYGYKWCKWVQTLEVVDYDYRGYYETHYGWSDAGTRGQPVL